ncbi:MAG TPA: type I restriction-modification system subunit M N-terminal domain-containing protein [Candidatus Acidoferrales bacterium]|jgi:type I restriction-modification system DNA methylase subunit|nr:type I restriction-modification system subunit M N-terminal domain-containing protein [Candidatus Acidoferrales bacterium]
MALKKSELYSSLWSSCDELRGGMDASQYKDYVLVLLFIKYPTLTEDEVQTLVVDDKWLSTLDAAIHGEMDRISQALTQRVRQLAERYETPMPQQACKVAGFEKAVNRHLRKMGFSWT